MWVGMNHLHASFYMTGLVTCSNARREGERCSIMKALGVNLGIFAAVNAVTHRAERLLWWSILGCVSFGNALRVESRQLMM
jgi:hypothetical protein